MVAGPFGGRPLLGSPASAAGLLRAATAPATFAGGVSHHRWQMRRPSSAAGTRKTCAPGWTRTPNTMISTSPTYIGRTTFQKAPRDHRCRALRRAAARRRHRGAPIRRRGQPPAGRPLRAAGHPPAPPTTRAAYRLHWASSRSRCLDVVDAGDADIVPAWTWSAAHARIRRKVLEVAQPARSRSSWAATTRSPGPSASAVAEASRRGGSAWSTSTPTPTPRTIWGVLPATARRCAGSSSRARSPGRNFVQVGLRGYWPPPGRFEWMREQGMRWHLMPRSRSAASRPWWPRRSRRRSTGRSDLPLGRHRRARPGHGARARHAGAGRHALPRAAAGRAPDRRGGRAGRHGRGGGARRPTTQPRSPRWSRTAA